MAERLSDDGLDRIEQHARGGPRIIYPPDWPVRGRYWQVAADAEEADNWVHFHRHIEDEVARVGPGVNGRWWVLMEPRRDPTPPHSHRVTGTHFIDDHPARCRSPRCWNQPVLMSDGSDVAVVDLKDDR